MPILEEKRESRNSNKDKTTIEKRNSHAFEDNKTPA